MNKGNIYKQLGEIQTELKAPKGQYNSYGKYSYRSAEDILESVKPLLKNKNLILVIKDDIEEVGARVFVKATAKIIDENGEALETTAYAELDKVKKGMDQAQLTGSSSSYARKYALNGLFAIDDAKDPDTDEYQAKTRNATKKTTTTNTTTATTDSVEQKKQRIIGIIKKYGVEKISETIGVEADKNAIAKKLIAMSNEDIDRVETFLG